MSGLSNMAKEQLARILLWLRQGTLNTGLARSVIALPVFLQSFLSKPTRMEQ